MKKSALLIFVLCLASGLLADVFHPTVLNTNDMSTIRAKLNAFQNGKISLEKLTGNAEESRRLVSYYLLYSNSVTERMKLPISRSFAAFGEYSEAANLASEYVQVYSNDWHGWRILGGADMFMTNFTAAIVALSHAAKLGDQYSYTPLALVALKTGRLNLARKLVPHLLQLKNRTPVPEAKPLDIVTVLILYSIQSNQQDVFVKALNRVSGRQIVSRDDLQQLVMTGCKRFKGEVIDKIREEVEAAATDSSSTPTNAPR